MRKSCDSSMYWCSSSASARADSRSWPNGFSTTTRAFFVRPAVGESLHDRAEEERRDLEVEHRSLRALDRGADPLVRLGVGEVAGARTTSRAASRCEHVLVELLARPDDRRARALDELVDGPVVDGDADDRAVEQLAAARAGTANGRS